MDFSNFAYTEIVGQDFSGQTIEVDGNFYTDCRLVGAEFIWRGEAPYGYSRCATDGLRLSIVGRAEMVVATIARMVGIEGLVQLGYAATNNAAQPTKN